MSKKNKQFSSFSLKELLEKLEESRKDLFTLRLSSGTNHIKDNSQFKKLRKNIARALTFINLRTQECVQEQMIKEEYLRAQEEEA